MGEKLNRAGTDIHPLETSVGSFNSPFGPGYFLFRNGVIHRVILPGTKVYDTSEIESDCFQRETAEKLAGVFLGRDAEMPYQLLAADKLTTFAGSILHRVSLIPKGGELSYGKLAEESGYPGASRAAGSALARNPFPLIIPCHRVVRADGTPGKYQGGAAMKEFLLGVERTPEI